MTDVAFRPFQPGDETAFRDLNVAWIERHFVLEEIDRAILNDPLTHILQPGGHILMATLNGETIGCCALLALDDGMYELGKMTVSESCRGMGVGRRLLIYAIEYARQLGANGLFLESSNKLPDAVHLYESAGFKHIPPELVKPSPYARSEVHMEMIFNA